MIWKSFTQVLLVLVLTNSALPAWAQAQGINYISNLKGKVEVKRANRSTYQKAQFGTLLQPKDRLRLDKWATATVLCSNLSLWKVPAGKETVIEQGCTTGPDVIRRPNSRTTRPRSGEDPTIPYLISPRSTAVLERQLRLRWHNIGAASYRVRVWGDQVDWSIETDQAEAVFPGESQSIRSGGYYQVEITANTGASSKANPVGFTFLGDEGVKQVQQRVGDITQLALNRESEVLALAYLYQSDDLKAAAIQQLETVVQAGVRTAAVYQLLGELYQASELLQLAKINYVKAFELAKTANSLEQQAELQQHLGEVNEALAQLSNALYWFRSAQSSYRQLGDAEQVQMLQPRINYLLERV
jgi:hypothetical protein